MDEAISRQSVIDMLDETKRIARQNIDGSVLMTFESVFDSLVNITNALPTIQPEPHWIPVTKPPKDRRICYVTLKDTNDENRQNWVAEMIYTPWDGFDLMDGIEAIAWMPKKYPEPYKGVTDGRD